MGGEINKEQVEYQKRIKEQVEHQEHIKEPEKQDFLDGKRAGRAACKPDFKGEVWTDRNGFQGLGDRMVDMFGLGPSNRKTNNPSWWRGYKEGIEEQQVLEKKAMRIKGRNDGLREYVNGEPPTKPNFGYNKYLERSYNGGKNEAKRSIENNPSLKKQLDRYKQALSRGTCSVEGDIIKCNPKRYSNVGL